MALSDLNDPQAVSDALDKFDRVGRDAFLAEYHFGKSVRYFVRRDGTLYDIKAVAAAAHGFQFGTPLEPSSSYTSGLATTVPKLRALGFEVVDTGETSGDDDGPLVQHATYTWEELGRRFDFEPDYLGAAGGMVSRPASNALLLMTHPGGARSIDYGDYWDGDDLVYTGRGKYGDQQRTGQNRDLGDNARELHVFEPAGSRALRYLGSPTTIEEWTAMGADANGDQRRVLRFRLRFDTAPRRPSSRRDDRTADRAETRRQSREFDPSRRPSTSADERQVADPAEAAALSEKATQDHHDLVVALHARLLERGWTEVAEIERAIDLWGRDMSGVRHIFEVKTIRPGRELARVRAALAQLLEYRFLYGAEDDGLCLVTSGPIGDRHARVLSHLGICVLTVEDGRFAAGSEITSHRVGDLLENKVPGRT